MVGYQSRVSSTIVPSVTVSRPWATCSAKELAGISPTFRLLPRETAHFRVLVTWAQSSGRLTPTDTHKEARYELAYQERQAYRTFSASNALTQTSWTGFHVEKRPQLPPAHWKAITSCRIKEMPSLSWNCSLTWCQIKTLIFCYQCLITCDRICSILVGASSQQFCTQATLHYSCCWLLRALLEIDCCVEASRCSDGAAPSTLCIYCLLIDEHAERDEKNFYLFFHSK